MVILFDVLARLPLSVLHRLGTLLGWVTYLSSTRYAGRLRENLRKAGLAKSEPGLQKLLHTNISEMGKAVMELPWVWRRPLAKVVSSVRQAPCPSRWARLWPRRSSRRTTGGSSAASHRRRGQRAESPVCRDPARDRARLVEREVDAEVVAQRARPGQVGHGGGQAECGVGEDRARLLKRLYEETGRPEQGRDWRRKFPAVAPPPPLKLTSWLVGPTCIAGATYRTVTTWLALLPNE